MRVNGSTGAIEGGIPISTIGFGVSIHGTGIGIDSRTGTLFALERCSVASLAPPCGRLLAYSPQTGALIGNLTLNADFEDFTIDSSTDTLYIAAAWEVQTAHVGTNTQGIIAVDTRNLTVKFQAPLNYAAIMDTSIDESTNTLYGIADKKVGNSSSVYLFSLSGNSGSLLLSVVVGDDCWLYGGMTLNTSTNQVYLYAHARNPLDESIVILDVATGRVVGMLPSGGIQDAILDPAHNRAFIIFTGVVPSDIGVATIPSAVIQGNVNPGILNATCPPRLPPGGVRP